MSRFSFALSVGLNLARQPKLRVAVFGDGYQQRVAAGINNNPRTWSLEFTRLTADIEAIDAFLNALNGASFDWLPPAGADGKWICKGWQRTINFQHVQSLSATFEEVFGD